MDSCCRKELHGVFTEHSADLDVELSMSRRQLHREGRFDGKTLRDERDFADETNGKSFAHVLLCGASL